MISQKYIDLMNQELDGVNSPEQSRELEDYLSSHVDAMTYYRELALAMNVFEEVDILNPPPELAGVILAALEKEQEADRTSPAAMGGEGLLAACRNLFRIRLQPAYAYTFIAGLVLGLAIFAGSDRLTSSQGPDLSGYVSGTANLRPSVLEHGSEATLDYPGLSGRYRILRDGPDLRLHLELSSTRPAVVRFSHGPHTALQHYSSNNPTPSTLTASGSMVELNHEGDESYDLVFRQDMDNQSPVTMSIFLEGGMIHSETLGKQENE